MIVHPLGYPLVVASTSREVLRASEQSWGLFSAAAGAGHRKLEIQVTVSPGGPAIADAAPVFRARQHLLTVASGPDNLAVCDFRQGAAVCWVTEATVAAGAPFRFHFLETLGYALVTDAYLAPVHASCVLRDGQGVLLCGESGAGKSTLAYACATRGWTFVSDDVTWLVRGAEDRMVLGRPHHMRFRPGALQLFPELRDLVNRPHPNGKVSAEIPTSEMPGVQTAGQCEAGLIVFLDRRNTGAAQLTPVEREEALDRLDRGLSPYGLAWEQERPRALERLVTARTFDLRYSSHGDAVDALSRAVASEPRP